MLNSQKNQRDKHEEVQKCESTNWIGYSDMNKLFYNMLLGSFSLMASLVTHPLTVLSVRQQAGSGVMGSHIVGGNVISHMKSAISTVGIRGMFRGWIAIAAVGAPSNVIYFDLMEKTRELFQEGFRNSFPGASPLIVDGLQTVCSSMVATFISLIPFVPGEVLSSRLIVQGRNGLGTWEMAKSVLRESGPSGFFRGFNSSFLVGMIGGAQWWFCYGLCRKYGMETNLGKDLPIVVECGAGLFSGVTSTIVAHPFDTI